MSFFFVRLGRRGSFGLLIQDLCICNDIRLSERLVLADDHAIVPGLKSFFALDVVESASVLVVGRPCGDAVDRLT